MSRVHITVRPGNVADVARLGDLVRCADVPVAVGGVRPSRAELDQCLDERLTALLTRADRTVLVAEEPAGEHLLGMVILVEDEVGVIVPVPVLRTSHLAVAPSHRRKGVGRALLAAATQIADERGIDHVVASSMPGSRDVNRYLARLGFVPLASRRIAPTAVLRRSLGPAADRPETDALARRARILRGGRATVAARVVSRGA